MNPFDAAIVQWLQGCVQRSYVLDHTIAMAGLSTLLRGAVFSALLCWLWWRYQPQRDRLIAAVSASMFGVIVARMLAAILPFRTRPLFDAAVHFRPAFGPGGLYNGAELMGWSSLFSDHVVLFSALATGIFFISRKLGVFSWFYALLVIFFPRMYLGIHYPTDILSGAVLGLMLACAFQHPRVRAALAQPVLLFVERYPAEFYVGAYLVTFQMSVLFFDVLNTGKQIAHGVKAINSWAHPRIPPLQVEMLVCGFAAILLCGFWKVFKILKLRTKGRQEQVSGGVIIAVQHHSAG